MIPVDNDGNSLWLKNLVFDESNDTASIEYRTTLNDIPFARVGMILVDEASNFAITGGDGTILYRFGVTLLATLMDT